MFGYGGMGMMGGRTSIRNDPAIPPIDSCLECGQFIPTVPGSLKQCSGCSCARFCNQECLKKCWPRHKKDCKELKKLVGPDKLRPVVQVLRTSRGATIANPEALVPSEVSDLRYWTGGPQREMGAFLMATIDRLLVNKKGALKQLCGKQDILRHIYSFLYKKNMAAVIERKLSSVKLKSGLVLSTCAADHLSVYRSLTRAMRKARYPAACAERWGTPEDEHHYDADSEEGIPLNALLGNSAEVCEDCGADGEQFFSFCMNRPVPSDRVHHCTYCGKCFYFRPGCLMGCAHCGFGDFSPHGEVDPVVQLAEYGGMSRAEAKARLAKEKALSGGGRFFEFPLQHAEIARGCGLPQTADSTTKGLAREGYWGF